MRDFEDRCKASGFAFPVELVVNRVRELPHEHVAAVFGSGFVEKYHTLYSSRAK
jgi:hypothetical protein